MGAEAIDRRAKSLEQHDREMVAKYRPKANDPYAQEVGPGAAIMRRLESAATEHIVEPMARAGWPNAGAAIATVPTVVADMVVPQTAGDFATAGVPVGKFSKALPSASGVKTITKRLNDSYGNDLEVLKREWPELGKKLDRGLSYNVLSEYRDIKKKAGGDPAKIEALIKARRKELEGSTVDYSDVLDELDNVHKIFKKQTIDI